LPPVTLFIILTSMVVISGTISRVIKALRLQDDPTAPVLPTGENSVVPDTNDAADSAMEFAAIRRPAAAEPRDAQLLVAESLVGATAPVQPDSEASPGLSQSETASLLISASTVHEPSESSGKVDSYHLLTTPTAQQQGGNQYFSAPTSAAQDIGRRSAHAAALQHLHTDSSGHSSRSSTPSTTVAEELRAPGLTSGMQRNGANASGLTSADDSPAQRVWRKARRQLSGLAAKGSQKLQAAAIRALTSPEGDSDANEATTPTPKGYKQRTSGHSETEARLDAVVTSADVVPVRHSTATPGE
jgi:hypothetical protein